MFDLKSRGTAADHGSLFRRIFSLHAQRFAFAEISVMALVSFLPALCAFAAFPLMFKPELLPLVQTRK